MKSFYSVLLMVVALPAAADISLGFGNRTGAPAEPATPQVDLEALPQAVKAVAGDKAAEAAEQQLAARRAAMEAMGRQYDATVQKIEALAPQVDAQLQQQRSAVPPLRPLPQEQTVYAPLTPEVEQELEQLLEASFKNAGITKKTQTITCRSAQTTLKEVSWLLPKGMEPAQVAKCLPSCIRVLEQIPLPGCMRTATGEYKLYERVQFDCVVELKGKLYLYQFIVEPC